VARPRVRDEWLERIKATAREFLAARRAAERFLADVERDPGILPPDTKMRHALAMSDNLEGTYLLRLFAAFETGLRGYWATIRATSPPARDLIDSIAGDRDVPDELRDEVHEVRKYRNALIHVTEDEAEPVPLGEARRRLCPFFARLPDHWKS
jgi:hypothetical protein